MIFKTNVIIHYRDVIMSVMASKMTGASIACSAVCPGAYQGKHSSSGDR